MKSTTMKLCDHILDTMFEKSLFSDLSLTIDHPTFPSTIRFDVHQAIVGQSPFFRLLLNNIDRIPLVETAPFKKANSYHDIPPKQHVNTSITSSNSNLHLTINLVDAMKQCGFITRPLQPGPHRQQQTSNSGINNDGSRHILSSHVRFALKWLYSADRSRLVKTLSNKDTLPVLCLAILLGLDSLMNHCLERYTERQLSIHSIVRDLDIICQLPRKHKAYLKLRHCALLMLLRHGPEYPQLIAKLPMVYMSDVLGADALFLGCEFDRYRLLRETLMAIMQSLGKVGPEMLDLGHSRTLPHSTFIQQQSTTLDRYPTGLKRKSISSDDNNPGSDGSGNDTIIAAKRKQQRLCFSSCLSFQQLLADSSSGGIINKATVLSYLLRTTVKYSNMSFDQLSTVRQDGIVDETIIFKALWQREALERQLFPSNYQDTQSVISRASQHDNEKELDGHSGTVDDKWKDDGTTSDQQHILLDPPRFRFKASVRLTLPHATDHEGWDKVERMNNAITSSPSIDSTRVCDNDKGDNDNEDLEDANTVTTSPLEDAASSPNVSSGHATETNTSHPISHANKEQHPHRTIYNKTVYTQAEHILGHWHRVRLEAQVLPRSLLQIEDEDVGDKTNKDPSVLVCRFELQRDHTTPPQDDAGQCKIRYAIYCLNRHEGLVKNDRVDPEDWMLVPVTEVTESAVSSTGYVGQVMLDSPASKDVIDVDMMVALEIVAWQ